MYTIKTIYLTLIHAALAAAIFLYSNDNYALAKLDHTQEAKALCCGSNDSRFAKLTLPSAGR